MNAENKKIMARIAAEFWADQISHKSNMAERAAFEGELATNMNLIQAIAGDRTADGDQARRFADRLTELLIENWESLGYSRCIAVDYHPHPLLAQAATEVGCRGVDMLLFPFKTYMWLEEHRITVREGHAAHKRVIWED